MSVQPQLLWHDPAWLKQAHDWIRTEAKRNSIQRIGEIEQTHAYAWSTVLRAETNQGTIFFKATAAEFRVRIREDWIDLLEHVFRKQAI